MDKKLLSSEGSSSDLEQFRRQWRQEVNARSKQNDGQPERPTSSKKTTVESDVKPERPINKPPSRHPLADVQDEFEYPDENEGLRSGITEKIEGLRVRDVDEDDFSAISKREPESALEHYERAVEKESQGSLGDSLDHYRKAYRLDAKVDQIYKSKHFPTKSKHTNSTPTNVSATASTPAPHEPETEQKPLTFTELITSYAHVEIPNAPPIIKGDVLPPCPIRKLPTEVLVEVLQHVAIRDPAIFSRLALVCKRLAYHVFRENNIWKRVALGREFGLASQQYKFSTDINGREAIFQALEDEAETDGTVTRLPPVGETLFPKTTDWREFFHSHPRIRFTGVYISPVNYTRAGGVSATPGTWNSTVHIVTYYRYLRFFRDGTVISLLSTSEPVDVVPHLTKENVHLVRSGGKDAPHPLNFTSSAPALLPKESQSLPPTAQNLLRQALRGRWRLCHPSLTDPQSGSEIGSNVGVLGDLHIETEGAHPRYMYTLHLSIRPGSKSKNAVKSNKLVWKGFWNYNHLTDDWSPFHLKNDKAFWFSRVKSYGLGY